MKKRNVIIVILVILLALGGVGVWLVMSGRFSSVATILPNTTVTIVCDDAIVKTYNDAREYKLRGDEKTETSDEAALAELSTTIRQKSGYENDPTCQTILFWNAYLKKDYDATKTAYEAIKKLHEKQFYANTNLYGIASITSYEAIVFSLSPEAQQQGTNGG